MNVVALLMEYVIVEIVFFEGATGPDQYVTDIAYHIENHVSWLAVVEKEAKRFKAGVNGITITGWQR